MLNALLLTLNLAKAATPQEMHWINQPEVQELHEALESYYLTCGFYPSKISALLKPIPSQLCKDAGPDAVYSDPDHSREKRLAFMKYDPRNPRHRKNSEFQSYEIQLKILESSACRAD